MTRSEVKDLRRLVSHLRKAQAIADRLDITLGNGGEVGGIIGGTADEIEVKIEQVAPGD